MSKEIDWSKAPEGATHAAFTKGENNHHVWYLIQGDGYHYCYSDCISLGWLKGADSKPSHSPLIERPQIAWTGDGLPPVGTVCEFYDDSSSVDWRDGLENGDKVKILAHYSPLGDGDLVAVFCYEIEGGKLTDQAVADCFRPIRTHEQIAAEERERADRMDAVLCMVRLWNVEPTSIEFYSAIDRAELLYDAGYRKTEASK